MCEKHNPKKIDECMKNIINLVKYGTDYTPLESCCGHSKYSPTLVVSNNRGIILEYFNMIIIPRKKRFYKKDKKGFYYIPEIVNKTGEKY